MDRKTDRFYEFSPFRVDAVSRILSRNGEPMTVTPKVFETLLALVRNGGDVLSKEELMKTVWPDTVVEEGNLTQSVFALRKALGESPTEHRYIVTVPGRGYRFVAPVTVSGEIGPPESSGPGVRWGWRWSRRALVAAVLAAAIAAGVGYLQVSKWPNRPPGNAPAGIIAVLPFTALGPEQGDRLGLGMADAVITKFSNIRQLTVRSTSAVIKYDGSGKDPRAAGRELGADSLVTGAIQRSGDRIRVTVQLLRVHDGKSLWAEKFDEKFSDVFAVQDSIAERVAKAFLIELNDTEKQQLGRHYTDNPQAYLDYVKGRYYWERRTPDSLKKGLAYFQEAIGKDPKYTLAYAGLADSYNMMGNWSILPAREAYPRSKEAAAKALSIDGTLSEARVALGFAKYLFDRDSRGAEIDLREGIRLDPNYGEGHQWYGVYLASRGKFEEAVAEGKRAQEVEPLSLIVAAVRGWISFLTRNYDDAIVLERNLVEIDPNFFAAHYYLGQAYAQKAMFNEAIRELNKAVDLSAGDTRSLTALAHAYAMSGQRAKAYNALARLKDLSWHEYAQPYDIGMIYASLNDKDLAFEWLEKAREERAPWLVLLEVEPRFDNLRSDPRFPDLVRRVRAGL